MATCEVEQDIRSWRVSVIRPNLVFSSKVPTVSAVDSRSTVKSAHPATPSLAFRTAPSLASS